MKRFIIFCLVFALSSISLPEAQSASSSSNLEAQILLLREKVSLQVEKVRRSREQADDQMALARIRIADQLSRAEESLLVQIELLDRLREQLHEQVTETDSTIEQLKSDRSLVLDKAIIEVEEQIGQTNSLIEQTRILKDSFDKESCVKASPPVSPAPAAPSDVSPPEPPTDRDTTAGATSFKTESFPVEPATAPYFPLAGSG